MTVLLYSLGLLLAFLCGVASAAAVAAVSAMQRHTTTPDGARATHTDPRAETPRQA